jgi:diacylglycerol kinase (ATP)
VKPVRRTWTGSFQAAGKGVAESWRRGPNFRLQLAIGFLTWRLAAALGANQVVIILASAVVLAAEAANTAVEVLIDLVSPDDHPLAGLAKDLAAGSVLIAAGGAAAVGIAVLLPRLLALPGSWARLSPPYLALQMLAAAALFAAAFRRR